MKSSRMRAAVRPGMFDEPVNSCSGVRLSRWTYWMSIAPNEDATQRTARRKSALVVKIMQGQTSISDTSCQFDLSSSTQPDARTA